MAANPPASASVTKTKNSPNDIVRVYNKTRGGFVHGEFTIGPNEYAEVPRKVADIWMSHRSFGEAAVVLASDVPVSRPAEIHGLKEANGKLETERTELAQRVEALEKLLQQARVAFAEDAKHPAVQILEAGLKGGGAQK